MNLTPFMFLRKEVPLQRYSLIEHGNRGSWLAIYKVGRKRFEKKWVK